MKALKDCNTAAEVCEMERDNFDVDGYALYCDGSAVTLIQRDRADEPFLDTFGIPKRVFDKLIELYSNPLAARKRDSN